MKRKVKTLAIDYFVINLGLIIAAIGIGLFIVPARIVSGGVTGIATILHYTFNLSIGTTMLFINIPLFLIGVKTFGKEYGAKTLFGIIMLSFYIDLFRKFVEIDNVIDFTKGSNFLLAPLFGGILIGVGLGLILKFGGSTGGTDIIAQMVNKITKIPVGYCMMMNDTIIIISGIAIFGIEKGLYAIIAMFTTNVVINKIFEGVGYTKMVYIISDKYELIREIILNDIKKGGTAISAKGLYTDDKKSMIMTVLKNKEIRDLHALIKQVDPSAFIIISEVYEVLGEGFKSLD
ncbi:MAG: YitT family protein [Psychrilyobacter sp.]|uniref:YitT family protein n=1 Tax=Psychrilyobacter sp. TaxID=2586924 RepID=UPI003C75836D